MALKYRRLRGITNAVLSHIYSGNRGGKSSQVFGLVGSLYKCGETTNMRVMERGWSSLVSFRFSTTSEVSIKPASMSNVLPFIESALDNPEGPDYCWLNKAEKDMNHSRRERTLLVLAGDISEKSLIQGSDLVHMFEKLKFLQQRFPFLHVMALLYGRSACSASNQSRLLQLTLEEYMTFPILLSNNNFNEMTSKACFLLSKDLKSIASYHDKDLDFKALIKSIEESVVQAKENSGLFSNFGSTDAEIVKESLLSSSIQNLLLYFPGCISADESGELFFLSDCNHHRIIVVDRYGKILDCIGSSPGFDDGEFESAKLWRPAASFYHDAEDCLYFVDSENHAVRRADMGRRVLETLRPTSKSNKKVNKIWTWLMDKLGYEHEVSTKPEEYDSRSLMFPWHLIKATDDTFLIINRSFETLWIMDLPSGAITEVVQGLPKILELYGHLISEKVSVLEKIPNDLLPHQSNIGPLGVIPFASFLSSFTTLHDDIILCDKVGQKIFKFNRQSGACSNIQFSNFGTLGLPYWLSFPLERVYDVAGKLQKVRVDHVQSFTVLPGRIDIRMCVDIPDDTELIEALQDGSVWRQARGAATEISGSELDIRSSEKVGVAQKWYDELDNLVMTPQEESTADADDTTSRHEESITSTRDDRIYINCAVNTSPGTSEVIIIAALYLKLRFCDMKQNDHTEYAERISDILEPRRSARESTLIQSVLKSSSDLRNFVFMRPLHVRIKFKCLDHPKAENLRDIILTDSSVEVNVSLST